MGEKFPVTSVTAVTDPPVQPCEAVCAAFTDWAGEVPATGEIGHVEPLWARVPEAAGFGKKDGAAGTGKRPSLDGASIASGYTPCRTRRGAAPAPPAPEGRERSDMQRKKTAIITARMTPEDKQKIEQRAANAGMTVTDYLTTCALGKKIVRVDGLDKILAELKAQGRNLNQLTVLANMERLTVVRGEDLADGYAALCDQLHRLTREIQ